MKKRIFSIILTVALILGSVSFSFGVNSQAVAKSTKINQLLSAGDYEDGSVLVLVDNTVNVNGGSSKTFSLFNSNDEISNMLSRAEVIMDMNEKTLSKNALIQSTDGASATAKNQSLVFVQSNKYSTKELLKALIDDPRVVAVEPNYTFTLGDESAVMSDYAIVDNDMTELVSSNELKALEVSNPSSKTEIADYTEFQWAMTHDGEDETLFNMFYDDLALGDDIKLENWDTYSSSKGKADYSNPNENSSGVIVVCDTGIDYTHPDLENVMYHVPESIYNKIGGGTYGINALEGADDTAVMDDHSHGTHCAGIIAAEWNGYGTSGVASGVKLLAAKCLDAQGSGDFFGIARSISYAADLAKEGVPVRAINLSLGGKYIGSILIEAVEYLANYGIVACVAAGNDGLDIDKEVQSSATFATAENVIVVGSSCMNGTVAYYSNYGDCVDLFAPGTVILSTVSTSLTRYTPLIDTNPLFKDTLDESTFGKYEDDTYTGITACTNTKDWNIIGKVNNTKGDIDKSCLEVTYAEIKNDWDNLEFVGGSYAVFAVAVPLEGIDIEDVNYASYSVKLSTEETVFSGLYIVDEQGEQKKTLDYGNGLFTINLETIRESGYEPYIDEYNNAWLYFAVPGPSVFAGNEGSIYIDSVSLGSNSSAYGFMSGTSMATPAVTGSVAVLYDRYKNVLESLDITERAAYLANIVKSSVSESRNNNAFNGYCSSGKGLNLSTVNNAAPVPVSAKYQLKTLIISGQFFGTKKGSIGLNGEKLTVLSWSDTEIRALPGDGVVSGYYDVEVTSNNGKSEHLYTVIDFNDDVVFERNIELPEGIRKSGLNVVTCAYDDIIYVLTCTADEKSLEVYSYDVATGSWDVVSTMNILDQAQDIMIEDVQMIISNGLLIVYGVEYDDDGNASHSYYVYDFESGNWSKPSIVLPADIPSEIFYANLLTVGENAYSVGGVCMVTKEGYATPITARLGIDYSKNANIFKLVVDLDKNTITYKKAGLLKTSDGKAFGGEFYPTNSCSYGDTAYVGVAFTWDDPIATSDFGGLYVSYPNSRVENVLFKLQLNNSGNLVVRDVSSVMPNIDFSESVAISLALDESVLMLSTAGQSVEGATGTCFKTDIEASAPFEDTGRKASLGYILGISSELVEGRYYVIGRCLLDPDFGADATTFMRSMYVHIPVDLEPKEIADELRTRIEDNIQKGIDNFTNLINSNKDVTEEHLDQIKENVDAFVEQMIEDGSEMHEDMKEIYYYMKDKIDEQVETAQEEMADRYLEFEESLADYTNVIIGNVIDYVMENKEELTEAVTRVSEIIEQITGKSLEEILGGLTGGNQ